MFFKFEFKSKIQLQFWDAVRGNEYVLTVYADREDGMNFNPFTEQLFSALSSGEALSSNTAVSVLTEQIGEILLFKQDLCRLQEELDRRGLVLVESSPRLHGEWDDVHMPSRRVYSGPATEECKKYFAEKKKKRLAILDSV